MVFYLPTDLLTDRTFCRWKSQKIYAWLKGVRVDKCRLLLIARLYLPTLKVSRLLIGHQYCLVEPGSRTAQYILTRNFAYFSRVILYSKMLAHTRNSNFVYSNSNLYTRNSNSKKNELSYVSCPSRELGFMLVTIEFSCLHSSASNLILLQLQLLEHLFVLVSRTIQAVHIKKSASQQDFLSLGQRDWWNTYNQTNKIVCVALPFGLWSLVEFKDLSLVTKEQVSLVDFKKQICQFVGFEIFFCWPVDCSCLEL